MIHCTRMIRLKFLTDTQGHPVKVFHGTCSRFHAFLPLSHFTVDENLAKDYAQSKRTPWEYGPAQDRDVKNRVSDMLQTMGRPVNQIRRIIPAYLRLSRPLRAPGDRVPDTYQGGEIYAYLRQAQLASSALHNHSDSRADFIYQNPFEMPEAAVKSELALDTLFPVSVQGDLNRSHLVKQRLIQFWEKQGYDGFQYTLQGKPAFVVFRPEQVYRLDAPGQNKMYRGPDPVSQQKVQKIYEAYLRSYRSCRLSCVETFNRVAAMDLWR